MKKSVSSLVNVRVYTTLHRQSAAGKCTQEEAEKAISSATVPAVVHVVFRDEAERSILLDSLAAAMLSLLLPLSSPAQTNHSYSDAANGIYMCVPLR